MTLVSGIRNLITRKKNPDSAEMDGRKLTEPPRPHAVAPASHHVETKVMSSEPSPELRAARKRIDEVADRLGSFDAVKDRLGRLDGLAERLGRIDELADHMGRLDEVAQRLERLDELADRIGRIDEVIEQLAGIGRQIESQAAETGRLGGQLGQLPEIIDDLGRNHERSGQVLTQLGEHLEKAEQRAEEINAALTRLTEDAAQRATAVELVQRKLDATAQQTDKMAESLDLAGGNIVKLGDYAGKLGGTCVKTQQAVSDLCQEAQEREARFIQQAARLKRGLTLAIVGCGVVSIAAIAVAVLALIGR